jgi:Zn-dependent protease with chaperone function
MDFFARQDHARALTRRLAWMFVLAVIATVVAVNLLTYAAVEWSLQQQKPPRRAASSRAVEAEYAPGQRAPSPAGELHLTAQLAATLVTLAIIGLGSLWKTAQLRGGGPTVAASLGGRPAAPERDAREKQLVNVVEEMSIASGVPMPQVFVLDREEGINAFAAGLGQRDAVVAVTGGALRHFTRDELQGVIGHEFSHILNGDMRINLRLMGLVHGILVIALTGRLVLRLTSSQGRSRRSDGKGNNTMPLFLAGLGLLVVGSLGYFFGQLIKAAISRQREFLADAAGVQFTRNPHGLGSALKKLGAGSGHSRVGHERTSEASHMFFGRAVAAPWFGMLATHPPLEERIRAIDPGWNGEFPPALEAAEPTMERRPREKPPAAHVVRFAGAGLAIAADSVVARVGTVAPHQVAFSAALLSEIPPELMAAAHEPFSARAVVVALLFGTNQAKAVPLHDLLERSGDAALAREVRRLHRLVAGLGAGARLPMLEISLPTLQQLSPSQRTPFIVLLDRLARADGVIDPGEYCLTRLVAVHLAPPERGTGGIYAMPPLLEPMAVLLSALVRFGHHDPAEQRKAFAAGAARVVQRGETLGMLPVDACGPAALDSALARLVQASPGLKRRVLDACAWAVAADGVVQPTEAELLRVVGMMLGCPLPPFADAA